jgi:hypothetical protein
LPNSILEGYTVTNKADGDRCFLFVQRDKRVIRVTPNMNISWTGLSATKDIHVGDVLDGEYLPDLNLFVYLRRLFLPRQEHDSPAADADG